MGKGAAREPGELTVSQEIQAPQPAPRTFEWSGEHFAEMKAPDPGFCDGCAFWSDGTNRCERVTRRTLDVFGGDCQSRQVVYVQVPQPPERQFMSTDTETRNDTAAPIPEIKASIKGYRQLSADEQALINEGKYLAETVGAYIAKLRGYTPSNSAGFAPGSTLDQRWVSIGATDLQRGFMAVIRGIAQPTTF